MIATTPQASMARRGHQATRQNAMPATTSCAGTISSAATASCPIRASSPVMQGETDPGRCAHRRPARPSCPPRSPTRWPLHQEEREVGVASTRSARKATSSLRSRRTDDTVNPIASSAIIRIELSRETRR